MDFEREEERIRAMWDKVPTDSSDESSSEQKTDYCSEHKANSDTEQGYDDSVKLSYNYRLEAVGNKSDSESKDELPILYILKCIRIVYWYKNCQRSNLRLRSENMVPLLREILVQTNSEIC